MPRRRTDVDDVDSPLASRDQVAGGRGLASDHGAALSGDLDLLVRILVDARAACGVGPEETTLHLARIEIAVRERHADVAVVDHEALDDHVAGGDREAGPAGRGPVHDHAKDRVQPLTDGQRVHERARLGVSVDRREGSDRRERCGEGDRVHAAARDVECDGVGAAGVIGVDDRLPERAGARIRRARDREGRRGELARAGEDESEDDPPGSNAQVGLLGIRRPSLSSRTAQGN